MRRALGCFAVAVWVFAELLVSAGASEPDLSDMSQRLVRSEVLRADFRQEKRLRVLSRPLLSHGKLVFAAGDGVLWQVLEPYVVFVLMKPGEVIEWGAGRAKRRAGTESNPVFQALTDVILATLSGDLHNLRQHFQLSHGPSESGWQLILRPKAKDLGAVVSSVKVFGDRFVERVEVAEARGDLTTIQFSGFSLEPAELNEIEKDYFSQ